MVYVHDQQGEPIGPAPLVAADVAMLRGAAEDVSAGAETPLPYGRGSLNAEPSLLDGRARWEGQLRFYPSRYSKTFQTWHENIRDWCISRQLWWGHRIPTWSFQIGNEQQALEALQFIEQLTKEDRAAFDNFGESNALHVCIRSDDDAEAIRYIEARGFRRDPDVLDTWFSSGLWPLSTLQWPTDNPALDKWNPSNVLTTAREIITLWVSRMVMFNLYFRDCLPFTDVFIHAMIQDGDGQKMSKSLGNGVDPLDIIGSHGADAMRYTLAAMTTHTQDLRMPVDLVDPHSGVAFAPQKITNAAGYVVAAPTQVSPKDPTKKLVSSYGVISGAVKPTADMPLAKNTSGKFDLGRNFCNKIWNAARFAMGHLEAAAATAGGPAEPVDEMKWSLADRWVVSRFNRTVAEADAALKDYRFDVYAKACYDFFWRDLCDWYLEAIKPAMKDPAAPPRRPMCLRRCWTGPAADAPDRPVHHRDHLVAAERRPPDPRPPRPH